MAITRRYFLKKSKELASIGAVAATATSVLGPIGCSILLTSGDYEVLSNYEGNTYLKIAGISAFYKIQATKSKFEIYEINSFFRMKLKNIYNLTSIDRQTLADVLIDYNIEEDIFKKDDKNIVKMDSEGQPIIAVKQYNPEDKFYRILKKEFKKRESRKYTIQ